jgi:hypothetical protein
MVYRRARLSRAGFAFVPVVLLGGALVLWDTGMPLVLVWLEVGFAVVLEVAAFAVNRVSVSVDDRRILVRHVFSSQAMEWRSVDAYYLASAKAGTMTISPMGTMTLADANTLRLVMVLVSSDGTRMGVLGGLHPVDPGCPPLAQLVREKAVQAIYPGLREAFDAGAPVTFGPVSVSLQSGVTFLKKRISPSEMAGCSLILRRGLLVLTQGKPDHDDPSVRWDRVPNVDIFLQLFYELKKTVPVSSWA